MSAALLIISTEHYRVYFRMSTASKDRQEFDDTEMRKMYKSFLDSTVIELCLPGSNFSHQALYSCLHVIEEESPKDLRRCPQLMWDSVGDLAVCDVSSRSVYINIQYTGGRQADGSYGNPFA